MSTTTAWVMLGIGIFCLILASFFIWFLILFKRHKKETKEGFQLAAGKIKYFQFWQFYAFVIVIFSGYIAAIVLLGISISFLV